MSTTSFLEIPRFLKPCEALTTKDLRREKERECEVSESIKAGLLGTEETLLKRNETKERF